MTTRPPDVDARRLVEIVGEAAALAEADRPAFLDRACGSDERLRQEAESLLVWAACTTAAADDVFREAVGREAAAWVREDDEVAPVVPGFRVVRELARGGMGVVYEAEQDRPRRTVALKVLRRAVADDEHRRRFDREAEVLARLEHPGIARIYGVITATDAAGERPCIVMERVVGVPITEHAARAALPWRARALLAAEVAEALQHAHARGIVHRDVKPANVLVDGSGRPRVVDLGIALEDLGAAGAVARPAGTLPYASPEQLRGPADAVDVRTDVYGLGMLTYELLAGRPALDVIGASTDEALRRAVEMVPVPLGAVDARLNGDVELVVARAVAKGPDARYPTVQAFADDLRRCVRDEPVSVRPPTAGYLLRKLVARHRGVTLAVSMLAASLVVGIVVALGLARAEARARTRSDALAQAADAARRGMATSSYRAMIVAAQAALLSGDADAAASFLETTDPAARGFEWRWLRAQVDASEERYGPADGLEDATPIAVAALGDPGTVVVLWRRPVGGEPTFLLERRRLGRGPRQIVPLGAGWIGALAGDGRAAWVASHQKVTRFDVPPEGSGAVVPGVTVEVGAPVVALAAPRTANGPVAAVAGIDGRSEVRLLRHDGTVGPGWRLPADRSEFAVRSDGLGVVVGTGAGDAVHLDASGARALGWHGPSIASIAVGVAPEHVAALDRSGRLIVARPGAAPLSVGGVGPGAVAWCPDGAHLVVHRYDGALTVVRAEDGRTVKRWLAPRGQGPAAPPVADATASRVLGLTRDGVLRRFGAPSSGVLDLGAHRATATDVAIHPSAWRVASVGADGQVRLADALEGGDLGALDSGVVAWETGQRLLERVAFDDTGRTLAVLATSGTVRSGRRLLSFSAGAEASDGTSDLAVAGAFLAAAPGTGFWVAGDEGWGAAGGPPRSVGSDPLAASDPPGWVVVRQRGADACALVRGDGRVRPLRADPAGVVAVGADGTAVAAFADGSLRADAPDGGGGSSSGAASAAVVSALAVTADGRRAAVGDAGGGVALWALPAMDPTLALPSRPVAVVALRFARDGSALVAAYADGAVRLWPTMNAVERRMRAAAIADPATADPTARREAADRAAWALAARRAPRAPPSAPAAEVRPLHIEVQDAGTEPRRRFRSAPAESAAHRVSTEVVTRLDVTSGTVSIPMPTLPPERRDFDVRVAPVGDGASWSGVAELRATSDAPGATLTLTGVGGGSVHLAASPDVSADARRLPPGPMDALRAAWIPVPDAEVGAGATWTASSDGEALGVRTRRLVTVRLVRWDGDVAELSLEVVESAEGGRLDIPGLPPFVKGHLSALRRTGRGVAYRDVADVVAVRIQLQLDLSMDLRVEAEAANVTVGVRGTQRLEAHR